MLLRFSVQNHLSIRDEQELSFAVSALNGAKEGLIDCPSAPEGQLLPTVVIYGANASGKSNFVSALRIMQNMILFSHNRGEPGGGVNGRDPFALDPACSDKPTVFDIDFVVKGVRYRYGFEAMDDAFVAEWLYSYPIGTRRVLFEREEQNFTFGRSLKGKNKIISELTRDNSLFLSTAAQNNHDGLDDVIGFFRSIHGSISVSVPGAYLSKRISTSDDELDERVLNFLKEIGTGVIGYRIKETEIPEENIKFNKGLISLMKDISESPDVENIVIPKTISELELAHQNKEGKSVFFDINNESAGTRRLLMYLPEVFRALDTGTLLIIDEVDASLHTKVCEAVLALFSSQKMNPKGAQLIATTHDTNLLRSSFLRRDQIWFAEKGEGGATQLYPLTDIRTRESDNIEKGYLQGRYGAMPFLDASLLTNEIH